MTRERLYLEYMERIFANTDKVIVDQGGSSPVLPYLPLPEMRRAPSAQGSAGPQTSGGAVTATQPSQGGTR